MPDNSCLKRTLFWYGLRCLKAWFRRPISGHYAVTRSLLAGLSQNHISFSYNPPFLSSRGVIVLSGIDTLRFAIEQKAAGRLQFLAAGPNICVLPSLCNYLVANEAVDLCITPSQWVQDLYLKDCPELSGRLGIWAAGVDTNYWVQSTSRKSFEVLVFVKDRSAPVEAVCNLLSGMNVGYSLLCYGEFDQEEYKRRLAISSCMIYLQSSESQGIALAEAWAAGVPTFVWNPKNVNIDGNNVECSSAPYLNEKTGDFWLTTEDLKVCIEKFRNGEVAYCSREFVLREMTDSVCAVRLMNLLRDHPAWVF